CNYCTPTSGSGQCIEGQDNHCLLHLTNPKECPDAPSSIRNEAHKVLMQKGVAIGQTEAPLFHDTPASDVAETNGNGNSQSDVGTSTVIKKRKAGVGTLNNYVDHTLTPVQRETANIKLFRYVVHSNSPFSVTENPYFLEFIDYIRPSYILPTRYVL
ncbi:uncharacterized protein EDB91DRAFT_1031367, partial [Suillus paluster]|uniref:uncharacterized protein n=1 Tax=Suillus paluster TaxID=48578 RepID=UPI001B87DA70